MDGIDRGFLVIADLFQNVNIPPHYAKHTVIGTYYCMIVEMKLLMKNIINYIIISINYIDINYVN